MKQLLYSLVGAIAKIHEALLKLNDSYETRFTDKELHFVLIGALGIVIFLITHVVFKMLSKWSIRAISWIYTMTLLIVITFGIEIGQGFTKTGVMEFQDILYGLWGFIIFFAVYWIIVTVISGIARALRRAAKSPYEREE